MDLRSAGPSLRSLRRLRFLSVLRVHLGSIGLGEGVRVLGSESAPRRARQSYLFWGFPCVRTFRGDVKRAVRGLFLRFLAATWLTALRVHAHRTRFSLPAAHSVGSEITTVIKSVIAYPASTSVDQVIESMLPYAGTYGRTYEPT